MINSKRSAFILGTLACIFSSSTLLAAENVTLKSSYLGDGLFKYEMTVHRDPFFTEEKNSLWLPNFTNLIEVVEHSPNWQFSNHTNSFAFEYPVGYPDIERPYSAYCIVRSTSTNYCTIAGLDTGAYVTGSLLYLDDMFGSPFASGNVAFYTKMEALIPCSPQEADGSPPVCERHFEIIPDLVINNLILNNGQPKGLSFSWDANCTVIIQASTNLIDWLDVEYALGAPPTTDWLSSNPLENYGNSYRILLAANGHHPELLSGTGTMLATMDQSKTNAPTSFSIQGIENGKMRLAIDTAPGAKYVVSIKHNRTHEILRKIDFTAIDKRTTVNLNLADFPVSASVEVTEISEPY